MLMISDSQTDFSRIFLLPRAELLPTNLYPHICIFVWLWVRTYLGMLPPLYRRACNYVYNWVVVRQADEYSWSIHSVTIMMLLCNKRKNVDDEPDEMLLLTTLYVRSTDNFFIISWLKREKEQKSFFIQSKGYWYRSLYYLGQTQTAHHSNFTPQKYNFFQCYTSTCSMAKQNTLYWQLSPLSFLFV